MRARFPSSMWFFCFLFAFQVSPWDTLPTPVAIDTVSEYAFRIHKQNLDSALTLYEIAEGLADQLSVDTIYSKLYYDWAYAYYYHYEDSLALAYFKKSGSFAKSYHAKSRAEVFFDLAGKYRNLGDIDLAISYLLDAEPLLKTLGEAKSLAKVYNMLGILYAERTDRASSTKYYLEALKISRQVNDTLNIASIYGNLGINYGRSGNQKKAAEMFRKAVETYKSIPNVDPVSLITSEVNLALNLKNLGLAKEGLDIVKQAYSRVSSEMDRGIAASVEHNLGAIYQGLKQFDEAISWFNKSMTTAAPLEYFDNTSNRIGLAECYFELGMITKAVNAAQQGLDNISQEETWALSKRAYRVLKDAHALRGNYQNAYRYANLYAAASDSVASINYKQDYQELLTRFEVDQKNQQIKLLEIDNMLKEAEQASASLQRNSLLIGQIALGFFFIYVYRNYREGKHRNEELAIYNEKLLAAKSTIEDQADQLRELDALKSKFFANISHELRTPLTLILGSLEQLRNEVTLNGAHENMEIAVRQSRHLLVLIEEILELTRLESSRLNIQKEPVVLKNVLGRIVNAFSSLAEHHGITLEFILDGINGEVVAIDTKKVEKILNNLLINAVKFTPKGGSITVIAYLTASGNELVIEVRDSGVGISDKDIHHIFDRFYQAGNQNGAKNLGTGIGLSLSKELAEALQGDLSVSSSSGEGSTFRLALPVESSDEAPIEKDAKNAITELIVPEPPTVEAPVTEKHHARLLLVEDHPDMRRYLEGILKDGFNVIAAQNGKEALILLKKHPVDLVLTDLMMPELDGFGLIEKIKELPAQKTVPIIVLSARAEDEDKLNVLRLGVDDYLTKPFNADELKIRVLNLLKNRKVIAKHLEETESEAPLLSVPDQKLLDLVKGFIQDRLAEPKLSVADIAHHVASSERQLYRKISSITGLTPVSLIREIRLLKAHKLLKSKEVATVSELCYRVGFSNPSYFSSQYKKRFGISPSDILKLS